MEVFATPEHGATALFKNAIVALGNALDPAPRRLKDPNVATSEIIKDWGDDNQYPQMVLERIQDVTLVEPILDWKARALYSGGLAYGLLKVDNQGHEHFERLVDPEIEDWLENTDIDSYLRGSAINFYTFYNAMAQLTGSRGTGEASKVVYLTSIDSTDWRYELKKDNGAIKKVYVSPDWMKYRAADKETLNFDLYDPFQTTREELENTANFQLCHSLNSKSPGRAYYQKAPWHVIIDGWMNIARAIPAFKKALLANQLTLKYIIKVPEWWWQWKYKDWDSKSEKDRLKIVAEEKESFERFFKGEKQGNSLIYTQRDSTPARTYGKWEVEVVDDKIKTGTYIEDSQEADAHIFKNLQVDSTLFGAGAGKDRSGAGSGSDKRVAWNNYMLMTKPHQDIILSPLKLISRYNGWTERLQKKGGRLVWWMKNYQIARLDSGKETNESNPATPNTSEE